jgi:hypothetical protein
MTQELLMEHAKNFRLREKHDKKQVLSNQFRYGGIELSVPLLEGTISNLELT